MTEELTAIDPANQLNFDQLMEVQARDIELSRIIANKGRRILQVDKRLNRP